MIRPPLPPTALGPQPRYPFPLTFRAEGLILRFKGETKIRAGLRLEETWKGAPPDSPQSLQPGGPEESDFYKGIILDKISGFSEYSCEDKAS